MENCGHKGNSHGGHSGRQGCIGDRRRVRHRAGDRRGDGARRRARRGVRLSKDGIEATVGLINAGGGQGIAIAGDVASEADVANMVARTVSAYGRLDCAYNNAGISAAPTVRPARACMR